MKTDLDTAVQRFPALRTPGAMLAARCALEWYELSPERAEQMFTEDCVYENRCDQGTLVEGPADIYVLLERRRSHGGVRGIQERIVAGRPWDALGVCVRYWLQVVS